MPSKKTQTKRKTKAGAAAKARSTRNARSTVKATGAETLSEPDRLTRRNLEIREYAKAMGLFAEERYEVAQPLFLPLTAAENIDIAHAARMRLCMCEQRLTVAKLKNK